MLFPMVAFCVADENNTFALGLNTVIHCVFTLFDEALLFIFFTLT